MEDDQTQQAILSELRMIRRAVRGILVVMVCGVVLAVLSAIRPELGGAAIVLGGIAVVAAVVGAILGIGSAKAINQIRNR